MTTGLRFRSRLVAAVVGVTVLTLGFAFFVLSRLMSAENQRQLDVALIATAHARARATALLGGERLPGEDHDGPDVHRAHPSLSFSAIYGPGRRLLAVSDPARASQLRSDALDVHEERCFDLWLPREHLRVVLVPIPGYPGHELLEARPSFDEDRDAVFLRRAMVIVFTVAVLWAALVATWVMRRLTRGHAAVASVAREVVHGNLLARVSPEASDPEMAQLGRDVNQMIDRLASLLRAQEEFIAHGAHELRLPLTTLSGELALALRRDRDAEGYRAAIESALESAQRLKGLAETLLTMARISSEEPPGAIALDEVLDRATRVVTGGALSHEVVLDVDLTPVRVIGREQDLDRLFCNLLENAIRHSPKGGRVQVRVDDRDELVSVHVVDEGAGVVPEDRERIFEPFYRGHSSYGTSGFGLGLAIAAKAARAQGGRISLAPSAVGADFVVELRKADHATG